jgi:CubicO group peptidase (beta-lactamase class C family)
LQSPATPREIRWDGKPVSVEGPAFAVRECLSRATDFGFSGVVVAARDGKVVLAEGFGLADREKGIPYGVSTVFDVGSITKQFTAAAILKLQEMGKLAVADGIAKYFKNTPPGKSAITLHHLLTHGSGLRSDFAPGDYGPVGPNEFAAWSPAQPAAVRVRFEESQGSGGTASRMVFGANPGAVAKKVK